MEADWSVEIGPKMAVIDGEWPGFVDLCADPEAVVRIPEAMQFDALRDGLMALNAGDCPLSTTKCDVWELSAAEIDPLEFEAESEDAQTGRACYVDVLVREPALFASFPWHEKWAQAVVDRLRECPVRPGRVDLVVREAHTGDRQGFGMTLYAAGCGRDTSLAQAAWAAVLEAAVTATISEAEILPLE